MYRKKIRYRHEEKPDREPEAKAVVYEHEVAIAYSNDGLVHLCDNQSKSGWEFVSLSGSEDKVFTCLFRRVRDE